MPACAIAHCVRPEQSKPFGPVPVLTDGAPSLERAAATAALAPAPGGAGGVAPAPARPSAASDHAIDGEPVGGLKRQHRVGRQPAA